MNSQTIQVDDLRLLAVPNAVNLADLFLRFTLSEWSLRPLQDDASRVMSALVTATVEDTDQQSAGFITVRLRLRGDCLVLEVETERFNEHAPVLAQLSELRTGLVPLDGGARLAWCELPLPTGLSGTAVPLPQRERRPSPAAEAMAGEPDDFDPQVMQRLLFGLSGAGKPPQDGGLGH
ncbi:hypothetical protein [Actinoalloteichus spitiensis]|uniref:hypothetical protein n=1 Tax=Actinoalloteichus spitiensis TaxID=252394 RepID=UPI00037F667A|nr:hypothetical protein [Actinoalloteichus spitiensis]